MTSFSEDKIFKNIAEEDAQILLENHWSWKRQGENLDKGTEVAWPEGVRAWSDTGIGFWKYNIWNAKHPCRWWFL